VITRLPIVMVAELDRMVAPSRRYAQARRQTVRVEHKVGEPRLHDGRDRALIDAVIIGQVLEVAGMVWMQAIIFALDEDIARVRKANTPQRTLATRWRLSFIPWPHKKSSKKRQTISGYMSRRR